MLEVGYNYNFIKHMVANLFGMPGTSLILSKPAIFHPCGSLPLLLPSFPKLSRPDQISCKPIRGNFIKKLLVMKAAPPVVDQIVEEDYFSPILFLCDNCSSKFSNKEYLTTHTATMQHCACAQCRKSDRLTCL